MREGNLRKFEVFLYPHNNDSFHVEYLYPSVRDLQKKNEIFPNHFLDDQNNNDSLFTDHTSFLQFCCCSVTHLLKIHPD